MSCISRNILKHGVTTRSREKLFFYQMSFDLTIIIMDIFKKLKTDFLGKHDVGRKAL